MADLEALPRTPLNIGREQMIDAVGGGNENLLDRLVRDTGIYGLTYFIQRVLDEHYPADVFGDGRLLVETWMSNEGGREIDPGVKWTNLLRRAVAQIANPGYDR